MTIRNCLTSIAATFALGMLGTTQAVGGELTKYVNPYIGSGGHGHVFVGANVPYGMLQVGPTQPTRGWDWCSGYHYSDNVIIGFGHTHLSGTGIGDLGDIALLPIANKEQKELKLSHDNETVQPGYYAVSVDEPNVKVELTTTSRVAMHRYTFGGNEAEHLFAVDLQQGIGWDKMTDCLFTQETDTRLTGMRRSEGWSSDHRYYFSMEFSQPVRIVSRDNFNRPIIAVKASNKPLLVKVALSPIDVMGAKENMTAELPGWDFDATRTAADQQ